MARANLWWTAIPMACLLWTGYAAAAEGVLLLGDDAVRVSRGGAGVASPRDASWIMLNPAGMAFLERRLDIGMSLMRGSVELHPGGLAGNPSAGTMRDEEFSVLPVSGLVWPTDHGVFGAGLYVPCGGALDFPHSRTWLGWFQGHNDRRLEYYQSRLTLAYAQAVGDGWAAGCSLSGSFSRVRTDHITPRLTRAMGDFEWDESFGAGFGLGVQKNWARWSLGAAYNSRQWSQLFDKYEDVARFPVDLPATAHAGVAFRPSGRLELVADYEFIHRSAPDFFGRPTREGGLGWNDQHALKAGFEWQASPRWTLRGGYSHTTPTVDDEHVFTSGLVPLVAVNHAALGVSYAPTPRTAWHLTYAHGFEKAFRESGKGDAYSFFGRGTRSALGAEWLLLGYTLKF